MELRGLLFNALLAGLALLYLVGAGQAAIGPVMVLVAVYTFTRGLVLRVTMAAAMEPMGHAAGLASGLLGALQMAAAALAASLAGLFDDALLGMATMLALFGTAALACDLGLKASGDGLGIHRTGVLRRPGVV